MSRRDWRHYRDRQRGRARGRRQAPPKNAREAVEALLREELGGRGFRASLELEAGRAAGVAESRGGPRRDLTALPTFTVDPATARDFDDAVSARREGDGVRLWIHIADVAAHVPPGSPLDREARRRGNSTYVPGAVEPMLPHALSEEACSLAPGVERLAVTAEIELGPGRPARQRELLPQPHPLRRAARLRPARRHLLRPRRSAGGGRRVARGRPRGRRGAGRAARLDQPRRRVLRARVPLRLARARGRRARRRPDRVAPPDRAADDPRQRAGRAAAGAQAGAGDLPRPRPARPAADRTADRAAARARDPDPAAARDPGAARGGRAGGGGEPAGDAGGGATRARPRRVYIARAAFPQTGLLQRAQQRPRRPRQRRLLPFHLADPPLPGPGRPPRPAGGAGGGRAGAERRRSA